MLAAVAAHAQDFYSPNANDNHPQTVLWGDTHLHTNMSVDANGMGNKALSPDVAYRFAKGEAVRGHNGQLAQLRRPLDFLVVSDHAVNLGVLPRLMVNDPLILDTEVGKQWAGWVKEYGLETRDILANPDSQVRIDAQRSIATGRGQPAAFFWRAWSDQYVSDPTFRRSVWEEVCANADRHNAPGTFTAFIGFEWTPATRHPKSPNLHRNVVFEGAADEACQVLPFSIQDSDNVEDLWAYLAGYEDRVGGRVLAIAHNGNLSAGEMFGLTDYDDQPLDRGYAQARARWEPLYEVTQYKGDSETHPVLSPTDEFADFETWQGPLLADPLPANWSELKAGEYARSGLKRGLGLQAELGINPMKFGLIGSSDAHTSLASVAEDNFWGKTSLNEPTKHRLANTWHFAASGMAAVWATENTREAIFKAMQRRETYATTGSRMVVRFFGGWDFSADDAHAPHLASVGYAKGVPMGADLAASTGGSPTFLIRAVKDPDGPNLDRIQVVKGWRDAEGGLHEQVYNVAASDGRRIGRNGRVKPVGSTVDVANAAYDNSIGDPELAVVWRDPEFDPQQLAFYYARVIEIPTPRWTAYDARYFGLDVPEQAATTVQDRAYTSPIWYSPD
jgi:hypothetical protein